MITWMQRHKKWLITTVWVSTIAFVGAGFVGWGSYDYGKSGGTIAIVGDREVSMDSLQDEYNNLYSQYSKMFGDQFNQEMAKQLKLEDAAYRSVIQKNLILNYADELGLDATDDEVAKELVQIPAFMKDGKFNKDTYIKVLNQNRSNPRKFEESLKKDLLIQKIQKMFKLDVNDAEIQTIGKLLFVEDKLKIKVIDGSVLSVKKNEEDLKKFHETNKNNYMSANSYELEFYRISVKESDVEEDAIKSHFEKNKHTYKNSDGKLKNLEEAKADVIKDIRIKNAKKDALRTYLKLKKGEEKFQNKSVVFEDDLLYSFEEIKKIKDAKNGTVLKPFLTQDKFMIIKVLNKFPPKPLSYEEAKIALVKDYTKQQRKVLLDEKAKEALENFSGENIGYVSRESIDKIKGLESQDAVKFLNDLFASKEKKDYIVVGDKAVVYEITDSRFAKTDDSKNSVVKSTINDIKNSEVFSNLLESLQTRYEVKSFYKVNN